MPPTPPLPQLLKNRDKDRLAQYTDALTFYEGKQWPAADPRTRTARRLTLNYVKTIINKTSTYVMQGATINAIPLSDGPADITAAAAVATYLAGLTDTNGLAPPPRDKTAEITEDWTDKTLDIWIDGGPAPTLSQVNPYGLIPFIIYPNTQVPKRWWGESDVLPLTEIAQELNRP